MAELDLDRVFVGLTRPQMFAGVTYGLFVANAVITAELFLFIRTPWVLLAALVFHGAAYVACLKEPRILDLWVLKASRCPRVPNFAHWGCNSYGA
jgi:type IV secretion system protein VirB3